MEIAPDQPIPVVEVGSGKPMDALNGNAAPHALDGQVIVEVPEMASPVDGRPVVGPPYKRGRGRSFFKSGTRKGIACQVPGCDRSLLKLREYYKRYKICAYHLELQCMVVEGQSIRFCQQCGRFQLLDDFDGDRRSCRRKLKKHNERRRRSEFDNCDTDTETRGNKRTSKASDGRHSSESAGFQPESIPLNHPMNDMLLGMTGDAAFTQQLSRPMLAALQNAEPCGSGKPSQPPGSSHGNGSGEPQIDPTLLEMLADIAVNTVPAATAAAAADVDANPAANTRLQQPPLSIENMLRQATTIAPVQTRPPHATNDGSSTGSDSGAAPNSSNGNPSNVDFLLLQLASALGVQPQPQQLPAMPFSSLPELGTLGLTRGSVSAGPFAHSDGAATKSPNNSTNNKSRSSNTSNSSSCSFPTCLSRVAARDHNCLLEVIQLVAVSATPCPPT